ncbi:MAG: hypothetical protein GY715_17455 [Planctomycetes bacterium]|nr:hypothetical protein [Planctomycetota bacterium]
MPIQVTLDLGLGAVCGVGWGQTGSDDDAQLRGIGNVVSNWSIALANLDVDAVRHASRQAKESPLYRRLSVAPFILEAIDDPKAIRGSDDQPPPGTHDLRRVAGRAAYYLEHVLPITLPTITETTSEAELKQIQASARRQYEAYRAGVNDMVQTYGIGGNVEDLHRRYRHQIFQSVESPGHGFWEEGAPHFKQMLRDFFPLGKRLGDLETIMGARAYAYDTNLRDRESSDDVTGVFKYSYHDHSMMFGMGYYFLVENGVITAVNTVTF